MDSQSQLDNVFLSYEKILNKLKLNNVTTKGNNEITHKDLRLAITTMLRKHPTCRWQSKKIRNKKFLVLKEGYLWIRYVYFQKEKKLIDADIEFFENRIKEYEKILNVNPKNLFNKDINVKELTLYYNRARPTIKKAIYQMLKINPKYRYVKNNDFFITKEGIEWLSKNHFKQKYLQLLEEYKMELTEKYIKTGYIYDNFFYLN